ncbi:hypothetical protein J7E87_16835 [Streptomyces sp. ISL-1]|uniref:hypothetical protein n=1 Tax=Streptomyces sp. ISL-1 TaxID=2817657 RepID=UPI001BEA3ECE|nr:hypothetical protein [Streptomyces sp. ISL-1]MBT2391048.1 hypothetical protein [Streptomyces sp. ISL-1]
MVRRRLKLAAVLVVVVLALTGFSSSSGGKGGKGGKSGSKGSSGGGGGCSSSKKSNSGYRDYDDDDYGSSSGSDSYTGDPTPTATDSGPAEAYVVDCVKKGRGSRRADTAATVKVVSGSTVAHLYEVDVVFLDAVGEVVDRGYTKVSLDAGETETVKVRMQSPKKVSRVKKCEADALLDD